MSLHVAKDHIVLELADMKILCSEEEFIAEINSSKMEDVSVPVDKLGDSKDPFVNLSIGMGYIIQKLK